MQKELKEIDSDKASGVTAEIVNDNLQHLIGSVPGPKDTPYEGGLFRVDIQLDAQYPFAPPKMRFMTRVWHPNVSSANGAICLGELGSPAHQLQQPESGPSLPRHSYMDYPLGRCELQSVIYSRPCPACARQAECALQQQRLPAAVALQNRCTCML